MTIRKTNSKLIIGTAGAQTILDSINDATSVGTVSIGGINHSNVQRVIYQSQSPKKGLDGIAVVSSIMAADNPRAAAEEFVRLIKTPAPFAWAPKTPRANEADELLKEVPHIVRKMVEVQPLVHNMINFVVVNFVANVALCM